MVHLNLKHTGRRCLLLFQYAVLSFFFIILDCNKTLRTAKTYLPFKWIPQMFQLSTNTWVSWNTQNLLVKKNILECYYPRIFWGNIEFANSHRLQVKTNCQTCNLNAYYLSLTHSIHFSDETPFPLQTSISRQLKSAELLM